MKKTAIKTLPYLVVLVLAAGAGFPLLKGRLLSGHDSLFYPPRTAVFSKGLAEGQFLPRWTQELAGGFGEPFFNFVAPLLHYLSGALHLLGLGLISSQNLTLFGLLAGSGCTMYLFTAEFFGRKGGLVAAAAYMFAPYALLDLYVRAAYSEYSAFAFPPLILWALYRLAERRNLFYLSLGGIAYSLLLLCNNPASLIFSPVLGLFALLLSARKRSLSVLAGGVGTLFLGLMLAAFFWIPCLGEKSFVQIEKLVEGFWRYQNHFLHPGQLVSSAWGYGLSTPGSGDEMAFGIGAAHLALAAFSALLVIVLRKRFSRDQQLFTAFFFVIGLAGSFLATDYSLFIWDRIVNLKYLQFSWRFLGLTTLATSFLCAAAFQLIRHKKWLSTVLCGVAIVAIVVLNYPLARPSTFLDKSDRDFEVQTTVVNRTETSTVQEYRPKWAKEDPPYAAPSTAFVVKGSAQWDEVISSSTRHKLLITAAADSVIRFNIHFFPGWEITIDGGETGVEISSPHGLMDVSVPQGVHEVEARFNNTPIRTAAEVISLTGLLSTLVCIFLAARGRRNSTDDAANESAESGTMDKAAAELQEPTMAQL